MNNWSWAFGVWWVAGANVWLLAIYYILNEFYELPPPKFETSWLNWWNNLINPVHLTVVSRLFTPCCSSVHIQPHMYVRKMPEDGSSMSDRNSGKYVPDYTALLHRKQQKFGTEVSGTDSPVSLAVSRYFVECESELCLPFWLNETSSSRKVLKLPVANG